MGGRVSEHLVTIFTFRYGTRVVSCHGVVLVQDQDDGSHQDEDNSDQQPYHHGHVGPGYTFTLDIHLLSIMICMVTLLRNIVNLIMFLFIAKMMSLSTTLTMSLPWAATYL